MRPCSISSGPGAQNSPERGLRRTNPIWNRTMSEQHARKQLLHLVFGGELASLDDIEFKDLGRLDIVGIYPNYATAYNAWKAKAQQTVDNAQMRYFIVHLHRLLDPETASPRPR
jgi:uncharacterized protein DUF4170